MPWVAPITGYVDNRGRALCPACNNGDNGHESFVGDNAAYHGQHCEMCDYAFPELRTSDFVRVSYDSQLTPEYQPTRGRQVA
jgi:hypothetical protein